MEYYFNDQVRWSLGWATPNRAGAFLAMLFPIVWSVRALIQARHGRGMGRWSTALMGVCLISCEATLAWGLAKTYSRGGLLAVVVAAMAFAVLVRPPADQKARTWAGGTSLRPATTFLLLALAVGWSGFHARIDPGFAAGDRAVLNRVDLWRGGLELLAASPWRGWGWGESGAAFMHWVQAPNRSEAYLSMVNSYLTVAVEGGAPLLAVIVASVGWTLSGWAKEARCALSRTKVFVLAGAVACWSAWLTANVFSNLWIVPGLWGVPAAAAVVAFSLRERSAWSSESVRSYGVWTAVGLLVASGLVAGGAALADRRSLLLARELGGEVILVRRGGSDPAMTSSWVALPDPAVLGETYGQEMRRWLQERHPGTSLRVIDRAGAGREPRDGERVLVFGSACNWAGLAGRIAVLVHPTEPPTGVAVAKGSHLFLAGIDLHGVNDAWQAWAASAEAAGCAVQVVWNSGLATDVRPRWPAMVADVFPETALPAEWSASSHNSSP